MTCYSISAARSLLPQDIQQVVDHLVTRVNEDYQLPGSIDLIAETRTLVQYLAKED